MALQASVGFQIPTNVVEVGDEISADQLAAITNATTPTSANPFLTTSDASFLPLAGGNMTGGIVFDTTGLQNINKGTFDNSTGGYNGISLTCAVGYELNWQGGHLGNWYSGAYQRIYADSAIEITHTDGLFLNDPIVGFPATLTGSLFSFAGGCAISIEENHIDGFNINLPAGGSITFGDSTTQTTAGVSSDKALANAIAASMWYVYDTGNDWNRQTGVTNAKILAGDVLSCGVNDGVDFFTGFPAVLTSVHYNQDWKVSVNGVLSDFPIMNQIV